MPRRGVTSNHWKFSCRLLPIIGRRERRSTIRDLRIRRLRVRAFARLHGFFLITAAFGFAAEARVYWRTDGGETAGVVATDSAWSRAYATMVRINGGRGGLEIWNARLPVDDTVSALRAKFSQPGCAFWSTGGGELICAIGCDGEKVFRFLISAGEGPRQSHVFQLTQTFDDFKASLKPPEEHLLKAAPAYPGSTEKSFLGSDATRTRIATSVADASTDDVRNFYATQMTAAGWQSVFQPGKGLDIYLKDSEVVLVSTETAGDSGGSRIMLLHKPLASGERE